MLLIGLAPRTARSVAVLAELYGLSPRVFATAEAALEEEDARLLVTSLALPGMSGVELAAAWRGPQRHALLLDAIPPALPATERFGLDRTIAIRDGWLTAVDAWLATHVPTPTSPAPARLRAAMLAGDADALGEALAAGALDDVYSAALTYLANAFAPDTVVAILERVIAARPDGDDALALVHDIATEQGRAGLSIVEAIATMDDASPTLRGRAMRHLGGALAPSVALALFAECLASASALVRLEAAHAALDCAAEHGVLDALQALARSQRVDPEVRVRAIDRVARAWPMDEASAFVATLVTDAEPRVARAASAALVRLDGIDADTLERTAASDAPFEARRAAMLEIAETVPWRRALRSLVPLEGDADPRVRRVAYELIVAIAPEGFEDTVDRALADGAGQAALLGALKSRRCEALARIAVSGAPERIAAIRALGARGRAAALPTLAPLMTGEDYATAEAAALAALHAGPAGMITMRGAAAHAARADVRARLLELLDANAPHEIARDALARGCRDDDPDVRATATRLAVRRAGAECAALMDRIAGAQDVTLEDAALDGAMRLGLAGFGVGGAIAYDARWSLPVRQRAVRWIERTFEPEDYAGLFEALEAASPGLTSRALRETTGPQVPAGAVEFPRTFWTDITQPERPAVGFDEADTRPVAVADGEPGAGGRGPGTEHGNSDQERREVGAGSRGPGTEHGNLDRERAGVGGREAGDGRSDSGRREAEAGVGDRAPHDVSSDSGRLGAGAGGRGPGTERGNSEPADGFSVARLLTAAPPRRRPALGLERARAALQVALRAGANGYRGLMTLAASDRVPTEVRVQALRHLASAPSSREDIAQLLARAMRSEDDAIQRGALEAAVVRSDTDVEPILYVAELGASAQTRARATRFLGSHWPVRDVRAALDARLYDDDPEVRRAALFAIFSSTRFVAEDRREEALVNLLSEHAEPEVRASAAHALGAFGGAAAYSALKKAKGAKEDAVRDAATRALARLEAR